MNSKNEISDFLSFFPSDSVVLAYFDKETSKIIPGCGHIHIEKNKFLLELPKLKDLTVHILVNSSDGEGRRNENITGCHAFFCDIDRAIEKNELKELMIKYKPHMVVQSSALKFHFYWRAQENLPLARWQIVQRGINGLLQSPEPNPDSLTHMLRMPGFERTCKDGSSFTPKLVYLAKSIGAVEPRKLFPGFLKVSQNHKAGKRKEREKIYAAISVDVENLQMPEVKAGKRNATLFLVLFNLVKQGKASDITALRHFAEKLNGQLSEPLPLDEIIGIIKSAWSRGSEAYKKEQRKLSIARGEGARMLEENKIEDESIGDVEDPTNLARKALHKKVAEHTNGKIHEYYYNLTGIAHAEPYSTPAFIQRFLLRFGDRICRTESGIWVFHSTRHVWIEQSLREYTETKDYFHIILEELTFSEGFINDHARSQDGELNLRKLTQARDRLFNIKVIKGFIEALFNDIRVPYKKENEFDSDPHLFFCANGVVNLQTGELREVKASDYLLKRSEIIWDGAVEVTNWEKFVKDIFRDNFEPDTNCRFMQEVFGYSLSGNMAAQSIFCHFGIAANGKSTLLKILMQLLGEYGLKCSPDLISKGSEIKFERIAAQLKGIRCCIIDDIDTQYAFNEAFVKNLTDTEISARKLYAETRAIKNMAKFHMGLNNLPDSDAQSEGYFRRIRIIQYNRQFQPNAGKTLEIENFVKENLSAIFKWAVLGYRRYLEQGGFTTLEESETIEAEYREDSAALNTDILKELYTTTENESQFVLCKDVIEKITAYYREQGHTNLVLNKTTVGIWIKKAFGVGSHFKKLGGKSYRVYPLTPVVTVPVTGREELVTSDEDVL